MRETTPNLIRHKVPQTIAALVKWLNRPKPKWLDGPPIPMPSRSRDVLTARAHESFLRSQAGFLIHLLNSRPDVAPPGYKFRKPRARIIEGRRWFRGWMLDREFRTVGLVLRPDSSPRNDLIYRLEPDPKVTGFRRDSAEVSLALYRFHSEGTLKRVRRCQKCERWYESSQKSLYCSRRCKRAAERATPRGRKQHNEESKERQRRKRVENALPTFRKDLEPRGYRFVRAGACKNKKCSAQLEFWREPRRRKGRGRPARPVLVPLKVFSTPSDRGTVRVQTHWPHKK